MQMVRHISTTQCVRTFGKPTLLPGTYASSSAFENFDREAKLQSKGRRHTNGTSAQRVTSQRYTTDKHHLCVCNTS